MLAASTVEHLRVVCRDDDAMAPFAHSLGPGLGGNHYVSFTDLARVLAKGLDEGLDR
jgi:hypothetical protein